MNKPLAITERQMRAIIRAAHKEGAVPEVKIGDVVVRIPHGVMHDDLTPVMQRLDRKPKGHL